MRQRHATDTRRRGAATFVAVVSVALVAIAVLGLMLMVRLDMRRTNATRDEGQLRQLLLAGQHVAAATLATGETTPDTTLNVPLPDEADPALQLDIAFTATDKPDTVTATVTATDGSSITEQRLTYHRDGDRWRLKDATLLRQR